MSIIARRRTSQAIVDYCERKGIKGCIVGLDQEKAYDKIAHDYLWKVLAAFKFPRAFIRLVQTLYSQAKTRIMVNGLMDDPIDIDRGVRQGDPMSCILYDLAIEPLAAKLRDSPLQGLKPKGMKEKFVASLFADDTLSFIRETDKLTDLYHVIDTFCTASTAKFNLEKTEFLPVGPEEWRRQVIETRTIGEDNQIPDDVKIIDEEEAMRTLGCWIGNNIDIDPQWTKILEKQRDIMDEWAKSHLSFKGKELVLKSLIQSRALFLATVNYMPEDIKKRMEKQMRNFMWDGKERGMMNWKGATSDKSKGGLNMPDIALRLEAIYMMWLKRYFAPTNRPLWAFLYDELLFMNIPK